MFIILEITTRGDKVCGVKVEKGGDKIEILAPIIISRNIKEEKTQFLKYEIF